ncbi:hypothetical protein OIU34_19685 [Pararhizobium sp. BT-229]|uniref:hypothetical protein n=1 Tax=Pararhizobium sp. BT-229 TaxID=2986923 RepID=UPI0021F76548|nr:hypothetical protein [Pararhizobium sp. BT-229]MCV9964107.1 hypothetical protein [Pararhizobium sp. BT-229]
MRIEFKVPVMANATPRRGRQPKLAMGFVSRTVDVPEYSSETAPVVLSGDLSDDWNIRGKRPLPRVFRMIGDDLYIDLTSDAIGVSPSGNRSEPRKPPFRQVAEMVEGKYDSMTPAERRFSIFPAEAGRSLAEGRYDAFADFASLDLQDVDETMLEACIEKFEAEASKLVLVDGKMYKRERPPLIEVLHTCHNGTERMIVRTARRQTDGPFVRYADSARENTPIALFQIDKADAAMAFAKSFDLEVIHWGLDGLDISAPNAPIQFNGPSATLHAVAVAMNDRIAEVASSNRGDGRSFLMSLSPAVMAHFRYLEETLPTADEENIPDELATAIEDILVLPEAERANFVHASDPGAGPRIWAALDLWDDRAVNVSVRPEALVSSRRRAR